MRVTEHHSQQMNQQNMIDSQKEVLKLQEQISSGKKFQRISDDPVSGNIKMSLEDATRSLSQMQRNVDDAETKISIAESALNSAIDGMQQVKSEAVKGANGTLSDADKETVAVNIMNIAEELNELGNKQHLDRYIFAGEQIQTKPFEIENGEVEYNGDNAEQTVRVSPHHEIGVSMTGEDGLKEAIQGALDLSEAFSNGNDEDIQEAMGDFEGAMVSMIDERSRLGSQMSTLDMLRENYEREELDLEERNSKNEDVDFAEAIMDFTHQQSLYQGLLTSISRMNDTSLVNHMR